MPPLNSHAQVIRALHLAGIEVLVSVNYCLTAEESKPMAGGLQGMSGLGKNVYYRQAAI